MSVIGKVLMVLENRPAPADIRVWAEAITLRDQGFQVSVISPGNAAHNRKTYACLEGIHLYSYSLPQSGSKRTAYLFEYMLSMCQTWWLSLRVLRRHGFDVIHAANPPDTFFFLHWFYRWLGKHFIFDQHDLSPELFQVKFGRRTRFLKRVLLWLEKCSYRAAALVLTTNDSQRTIAIRRGGCNPEKVFVVRNGPDLCRLHRVPAEPALKRGYPFLLVYIGIMEVQDEVRYALQALHELVFFHRRKDISLALLGDGGDLSTLQALVQELSLENFVHFTGWVGEREIARYLSTADIGLCPDPRNGLNEFSTTIKAMEYMAMGLPIVAFDLAETRYTTCESALYATPNSIQDFASQILRLLDNPELRATMGEEARARIEAGLSWEHASRHLLRAYATIFPGLQAIISPPPVAVPDNHSSERDKP